MYWVRTVWSSKVVDLVRLTKSVPVYYIWICWGLLLVLRLLKTTVVNSFPTRKTTTFIWPPTSEYWHPSGGTLFSKWTLTSIVLPFYLFIYFFLSTFVSVSIRKFTVYSGPRSVWTSVLMRDLNQCTWLPTSNSESSQTWLKDSEC